MRNWLELKLVRHIQVFLGFANFYWQFIQIFSRIASLLTSILKIRAIQLTERSTLSVDVVGDIEIDNSGGGNEMFQRLPFYTKSIVWAMGYLTPAAEVSFI